MAGITLAQAEAQLAVWLQASIDVAAGQSVSVGDRTFTLANAAWIQKQISYWDAKVKELSRSSGGGMRVRGVTPV